MKAKSLTSSPFALPVMVMLISILNCQPVGAQTFSYSIISQSNWNNCTPFTVKFAITNKPTGTTQYLWDFGDGPGGVISIYTDTVSHTYTSSGFFTPNITAYLVAPNIFNSLGSYKGTGFNVNGKGNIITSSDNICLGETLGVNLNGYYNSPNWDFGDGYKITNGSVNHTYPAIGTYTINAIVYSNACSRTDTLQKVVAVATKAKPSSNFNFGGAPSYCPGDPINFNARDYYASSYVWSFGDGSPASTGSNVTHAFSKKGTYTVSLSVFGKCDSSKSTQPIKIEEGLKLPNNLNLQVMNRYNNNTNTSWPGDSLRFGFTGFIPASAVWHFGNGDSSTLANPTYAYKRNGNYTVTVKFRNGCGADSTLQTNMSINMSYAPLSINYNTDVNSGCRPLTVHFNNISTGANYYKWNFGDGANSTSVNAVHTYTQSGHYQVQMMAYDTTGGGMAFKGQANNMANINVNGANMDISADTACVQESVGVNYNPSNAPADWDFGDGYKVTDYGTQHTYADTGVYTISCIYYNGQCSTYDTLTKQVVIRKTATPSAYFNFNGGGICPHDPVNFWVRNMTGTSYAWNFGDGKTSTQTQPVHSYDSVGTYKVQMTITTPCGQNTYADTVRVLGNLHFGNYNSINVPAKACPNEQVNFYFNNGLRPYKQMWRFGNGDSSTAFNPTYAFAKLGTYTVTCQVTNGCGKDTILSGVIVIGKTGWNNASVNMNINKTGLCPGDPLQYQVQTLATKYFWNFGDGSGNSSATNGQYFYKKPGTYTVSLTLTNFCGVDTVITYNTPINVSNGIDPTVSHNGNGGNNWGVLQDSACVGDSILIYAFQGAHYSYDFGDGNSTIKTFPYTIPNFATVDMVKHAYAKAGTYKIRITYYNNCDNFAMDSLNVVIGEGKGVTGGIQSTCGHNNCAYQACAPVPFIGVGGNSFAWKFGDGDSLMTSQPAIFHTYSKGGIYHYSLKVTNACGKSAIYKDSLVISAMTLNVNSKNITCNGGSDGSYKVNVSNGTSPYLFAYNNGAFGKADTAGNLKANSYTVTVKDANGCTATAVINIAEPAAMVLAPIATDPTCRQKNGSITLGVTGNTPDYSYYWSNKASTANLTNLGSGIYNVTVTDSKGCTGTTEVLLNNSGAPSVSVNSIVNLSCSSSPNCTGTAIAAPTGGATPYVYTWSSGSTQAKGSGLCVGLNYVTVTDHVGCVAVTAVSITQPSPILISALKTDVSCAGSSTGQLSLNVSGGNGNYAYSWSNGKSTATTKGLAANTYTVKVIDNNSCSADTTFTILDGVKPNFVPICFVTVDSLSLHNHIVWEKPLTTGIDSFIIYREITTNVYKPIGAVPYKALSDYVDTTEHKYFPNTGNPNLGTYRYKLQVRDTCGNYSALSPYHNTVYINQSNGTFTWNQYEIEGQPVPIPGLSAYNLFRDDNLSGFRILNSVAGSQTILNDPNYIAYPNARWRVETNWNISCSPSAKMTSAASAKTSRSNVRNNDVFITGLSTLTKQENLFAYPNPVKDELHIACTNASPEYKVEMLTILGERVLLHPCDGPQTTLSINHLNNGLYFLKVYDPKGAAIGMQKIVISR